MGTLRVAIETIDAQGSVIDVSEAWVNVPVDASGEKRRYLLTIGGQEYFFDKEGTILNEKVFGFSLTEKQNKEINDWKEHIKAVFGEYGNYEYTFKPTEIGNVLIVYSEIADVEKDFTDVDSW